MQQQPAASVSLLTPSCLFMLELSRIHTLSLLPVYHSTHAHNINIIIILAS